MVTTNITSGWLTGSEIIARVKSKHITIDPFDERQVNPNSYNYRLSPKIRRLKNSIIDLSEPDDFEDIEIPDSGLILSPNECYLGATQEVFGSDYFASLVTGRSSVGRKFVTNHVTAGLIDQGFFGQITLEITVQRPTRVYSGFLFGQIFWFTVVGEPRLYTGKYVDQRNPTASMAYLDRFKDD